MSLRPSVTTVHRVNPSPRRRIDQVLAIGCNSSNTGEEYKLDIFLPSEENTDHMKAAPHGFGWPTNRFDEILTATRHNLKTMGINLGEIIDRDDDPNTGDTSFYYAHWSLDGSKTYKEVENALIDRSLKGMTAKQRKEPGERFYVPQRIVISIPC